MTIHELRSQFAEVVITKGTAVLEEALVELMVEGVVYEMGGRYFGL